MMSARMAPKRARAATILSVWLSMFGMTSTQSKAYAEACKGIPDVAPVIEVCQHDDLLSIETSNRRWEWRLERTMHHLRQIVEQFLAVHAPENLQEEIKIAVWLSVPEVNPDSTRARIFVDGAHHSFVVGVSLDPETWQISRDAIAVLPEDGYPSSYGWRSESVLLEKSGRCSTAQLTQRVEEQMGHGMVEHFSGQWFVLRTSVFAEIPSAQFLMSKTETRDCIQSWTLNHMFEWIAWRDVAFAFSWSPNQ
jgi:hypothetical protein